MHRRISKLAVAALIAAAVVTAGPAGALEPCPPVACIAINGAVVAPHGEPVPDYTVIAQRSDGYNETTTTNADGRFAFALPMSTPDRCYQIVGQANAFHANTRGPAKQCSTAAVTLSPAYRINAFSGYQKNFIHDSSRKAYPKVEVSALSRTFPAPFHTDPLPWVLEHHDPSDGGGYEPGWGHAHEYGTRGEFDPPTVRTIADGVWQYQWRKTIKLPADEPGFYGMDWGRAGSVFDPMMDCRMYWFGFGISGASPAKAVPGTVVTISGVRLGDEKGTLVLKGGGQVTTIGGAHIVSWTPSEVRFLVPPTAKTGWISVVPPSGIPTNEQPLAVGA
ncbi:MAG TPA: carboxypeptidase regulatory-like domain-containing protein [Actinomycetota bacterium]